MSKGILLLRDNAPTHILHVVMQTVGDLGLELLEHPPYLPDLVPFGYHVFTQLKKISEGCKPVFQRRSVEAWFAKQGETLVFHKSRGVTGSL